MLEMEFRFRRNIGVESKGRFYMGNGIVLAYLEYGV